MKKEYCVGCPWVDGSVQLVDRTIRPGCGLYATHPDLFFEYRNLDNFFGELLRLTGREKKHEFFPVILAYGTAKKGEACIGSRVPQ